MVNQVRTRILNFLQLAQCEFRQDGRHIYLKTASLYFEDERLRIERPGKPSRSMPYQRLNLDKLLMILNPAAAAAS